MTAKLVDPKDKEKLRRYASHFYTYFTSLESKPTSKYGNFGAIMVSFLMFAEDESLYEFVTDTGHVVGLVCASVVQPWWTDKTLLEEVFVICLDPQFKGFGRVAMKFLKNKARQFGCSLMTTGNLLTDEPKKIENLYQKHGHCNFSYKNFVWLYPLN